VIFGTIFYPNLRQRSLRCSGTRFLRSRIRSAFGGDRLGLRSRRADAVQHRVTVLLLLESERRLLVAAGAAACADAAKVADDLWNDAGEDEYGDRADERDVD
ncbi:hypothetical protein PFISCL1PPCAC_7916, partial [Pristionchus fissidentatus]